jgi:hypothetical protein
MTPNYLALDRLPSESVTRPAFAFLPHSPQASLNLLVLRSVRHILGSMGTGRS